MNEYSSIATYAQREMDNLTRKTYAAHQKLVDKIHPGFWVGKRCFIVGGGPSLKNFDFVRIRREQTIGINRSFEYVPTDLLYFMDHDFYQQVREQDAWKRFPGVRVAPSQPVTGLKFDETVYLVWRRLSPIVSTRLEDGVYAGTNSGLGAIMLAAAIGCKQIFLLGYDMKTEGDTHWHPGYKNQTASTMDLLFKDYVRDFEVMAPLLAAAEVEIINLNPESGLNCFKKMNIEELSL